jgi:hypothetical protein
MGCCFSIFCLVISTDRGIANEILLRLRLDKVPCRLAHPRKELLLSAQGFVGLTVLYASIASDPGSFPEFTRAFKAAIEASSSRTAAIGASQSRA